jgi:ADP-ribose pyrophosphatase YjhB (NUDIX family)
MNNNNELKYEHFCNNCGKNGHIFNQCKLPITSFGVISFRMNHDNKYEFLMIRRKDTLGYIDFMRGKYSVNDKDYIINLVKQMTIEEKMKIKTTDFDELWKNVWGKSEQLSNQYKSEQYDSMDKFNKLKAGVMSNNVFYTIDTIILESETAEQWTEPEWGFPKGRRNYYEKDYDCALREFFEETGYNPKLLKNIHNILPFEEIFTGSNYKSYKHKYYLMFMQYENSIIKTKYEETEVSEISWKTLEECVFSIRHYNLEKIKLISNIHTCLMKYKLVCS